MTATLEGGEWSAACPGRTLPPGKSRYPFYRRLGGPQGWSGLLNCYLLTYSMVQSPSWEASWFAASQEIPCISWNPKVHYRTHKRPPPLSILGQPNPVHIPTSHLLEIHPNIIHPSMARSPQWSPSLQFPQQDPIHPPLLTHTCHMNCYIIKRYSQIMYQSSITETVVLHNCLSKTIFKESYLSFVLCTPVACQWGNYVLTFK